MASKSCSLRQHIRGETAASIIPVDLSLEDNVLKYLLHSRNLSDYHSEKDFEVLEIDEPLPEFGSLAILHTQNGFAFLEALSEDVFVALSGCNFDGVLTHTGMRVRPSTNGNMPSTLQLLPGQSFYVGRTTLSLVPEELSNLKVDSSELPESNPECYNYQVSQVTTPPQRAVRVDPTVMESPQQHRDQGPKISTSNLDQMSGQAISGREDGKKWAKSPLKREVLRTVRDFREHGSLNSQRGLKKVDECVVDAGIGKTSHSSSQPDVKVEDGSMAHAVIPKSVGEVVVDLEELGMAGKKIRSEGFQKPGPLPEVHPEEDPGSSGNSRVLEKSTCVTRAQPERRPEALDHSPFLQATSGRSSQLDDDADDTPVRKRARTATVLQEALNEEAQDSLESEIAVKRATAIPTDRPVSMNQASTTDLALLIDTGLCSDTTDQSMTESPASAEVEHVTPKVHPNPWPHHPDRQHSESSSKSTGRKPQTLLSDRTTNPASPIKSVDPSSSTRSTRSAARDDCKSISSTDTEKRICFASSSSAGDSKPFLKFLSSKDVQKVKSVHDCTVLCIGKELKRTSKLILAVLLGKEIITDNWVTDSVKGNDLLGFEPYMARDPAKESAWGISLDQAISRGKKGLKILHDRTIVFTPSAKKELGKTGFDELGEIAKCAGAKGVASALPKKGPQETTPTVVVGTQNSTETAELHKLGWRVYVKDIVSLSVLRGQLNLESDEFLIKEHKKESRKRKR